MTPKDVLQAIEAHYDDGIRKHGLPCPLFAVFAYIRDYLEQAETAWGSKKDPDHHLRTAKRLAQVGGLCVKGILNIHPDGIPTPEPPDEP